jgi:hypothetical protein
MRKITLNKGETKIVGLVVAFLLIIVAGGALYFLTQVTREELESSQNNVEIENRFENKIVYTSNQDVDVESLRQHCAAQKGVFNECGNICEPGADICASVCAFTCEFEPEETDVSNWQTYENSDHGFSIKYPQDWSIAESNEVALGPKFTIYRPFSSESGSAPFDHFVNATHVSIYPLGIPTEGILGENELLDWEAGVEYGDSSRRYVLESDETFAVYMRPQNPPSSWNGSGFVWARVRVDDLESACIIGGEEVDEGQCNPLINDDAIIVRRGEIDESLWKIEREILKSLTFTEPSLDDLIRLDEPQPNETVSSPLTITGEARGTWFFEASFPVVLTNWDGLIIAEGVATAEGDWMTEDFVPFSAELEFDSPYSSGDPDFMQNGSLILQKDNPSGLPENDNALEIRIKFAG